MSLPDGTSAGSDDNDTCGSIPGNNKNLDWLLQDLKKNYAHQPTFLQAVTEMAISLEDLLETDSFYKQAFLVMTEPERTISFRVPWMDDQGQMRHNRGWRVEFSRFVFSEPRSRVE